MEIDQFNVNCSIIFTELDPLERPAAAAAAGFRSIESWWPFASPSPQAGEIAEFAGAIERAGVELRALNFYGGSMGAGERGVLSNPARQTEFDESVAALDLLASRLGCRVFNALYGLELEDREAQFETAIRRLAELEAFAADRDATIVLEPISGIPNYPLKLASDAFRVIDAVSGSTHLKLLADLYHLGVNGDDIVAVIDAVERVGHVQIADAPGRHEPGTGTLPISAWLNALEVNGYAGAVGLEYQPLEDSAASLEVVKADLLGLGR